MVKHTAAAAPEPAPEEVPEDETVPYTEPEPEPEPEGAAPLSASDFDAQGDTWQPSYRSALDNPTHPLHHLRNT